MLILTVLVTFSLAAKWPLNSPDYIETFVINPQILFENRQFYLNGNRALNPAINRVLRLANAAAADKTVYSVTAKPANHIAPSKDIRDYYSFARYYWKNTTNPSSTYVRIDGLVNPEIYLTPDATYLRVVIDDVYYLGLAYFFTNNETYAATASSRIRTFFTSNTTGMNPNLNYANWIQNSPLDVINGPFFRGSTGGLLDFSFIHRVIDSIGLIRNSVSFTSRDYQDIKSWFTKFLTWLETSKRGVFEASAINNQGTWNDVQKTTLYLFLGQPTNAANIQTQFSLPRIESQFNVDGSQPLEMLRSQSWSYSILNIEAYLTLGALGKSTSVDVYRYKTFDGKSVIGGLQYLIGYGLNNGTGWPVYNTDGFNTAVLGQLCKDMFVEFGDLAYKRAGDKLAGRKSWAPQKLWAPFNSYDSTVSRGERKFSSSGLWLSFLILFLMF